MKSTIPLSEAIRLGSMLRPQAFGALYDGTGSCAFGAAKEAIGSIHVNCDVLWPWIHLENSCPSCGALVGANTAISIHLNDTHRWTRERIADWVETVEPKIEAPIVRNRGRGVGRVMTDESHIIVGNRPMGVHCKLRLLVFLGLVAWLAFIGLAVVVTKAWELL